MSQRKSPYQRIMRAANAGRGTRLSAEDCIEMSMDTAISELAANDDEDQQQANSRRFKRSDTEELKTNVQL